jgi:hypothetical protein
MQLCQDTLSACPLNYTTLLLYTHIREEPGRISVGSPAMLINVFRGFPHHLPVNIGILFRLGDARQLPNNFSRISNLIIRRYMV